MSIFQKMLDNTSPRQLFLVDSMGALLSATMLGLVLTSFESFFGMPSKVLHGLSFMATIFFLYSLTCYIKDVKNGQFYLKIIAIANLFYCCISIGLMIYFHEKLTTLGLIYFINEKIVVSILAIFEWKKATQ